MRTGRKAAASEHRTRNLAITSPMRNHYTNFVCVSTIFLSDNLSVLAGTTPTELRWKRAALSLARRTMDSEHLFHDRLLFTPTTYNSESSNRGTLFYTGCGGTT